MDADDPILGFATGWVRVLAKRVGWVDVITMRRGRVDVPGNVRVTSVGKERGHSEARRAVHFYASLISLLRRHRYDACFAHMIPVFAVMAAPLLRLRGVPLTLWYTHGGTPSLLRVAEKLVDRVLTASAESFAIPSRKAVVSGHGIDVSYFSPADEEAERATLLTVGRIAPVKRLEELIEATQIVARDEPGIRLRIVGPEDSRNRSYGERIRKLISEQRERVEIDLLGPLRPEEVVQEYRRAWVVVNLSDTGSFDKSLLEAMSCGVPVITSSKGGGKMVSAVCPALAVPQGDPSAVAAACKRVLDLERAERADLGEGLRAVVVERHSLERLADSLVSELLARRRR